MLATATGGGGSGSGIWERSKGVEKKNKQCSPGGVVSSTILHRGIISREHRCELEQKLAAFGGKAGSFYFS